MKTYVNESTEDVSKHPDDVHDSLVTLIIDSSSTLLSLSLFLPSPLLSSKTFLSLNARETAFEVESCDLCAL